MGSGKIAVERFTFKELEYFKKSNRKQSGDSIELLSVTRVVVIFIHNNCELPK